MEVKDDELKDKFELMVESTYAALPRYDVKTVKGDLYTNIGKEKFFRSTIGKEIKHDQMTNGLIIALINCNGKRNWDERKNTTGVDFATVKKEDMPNSEICKSIALFSTAFTEVLKVIKFKNNSLSGKRNGLKLNKNKDEKNENASPVLINSTSIQSNAVTSGQTRINIVSAEQNKPSNNNISSSSSSSLIHNNRKVGKLKDRTVTSKESDSKKVNSRQTIISETTRINELQTAKEISENVNQSKASANDVPSTPLADSGVTSNTQQQKKGINQPSLFANKEERKNFATSKSSQRRTGMGCTLRDRTYNPEKHCGVLAKENAKPCTRSLTCKTHSITLRRAVTGRSKSFDVLLADHRKDKEMSRVSAGNNCASIITTERNSAGNNIQHKSILQIEEPLKVEPKTERGNQVVAAHRTDNPTLDLEKKLHFSLPVSIRPKEILETKLKNNNNIDHSHSNKDSHNSKGNMTDNDVAKKLISEINGISKSEITSVCTDLSSIRSASANSLSQSNSTNNHQSSKENSIDVDKRAQASEQTDRPHTNVQFLANRQCHPLWRRNRGLLYTTPTKFPRLTDRLILQNVTEINTAQIPSSGQIDTSNSTCLLQAVEQCTKALLAASSAPARPTFVEQQPKKSIELRTNLPVDDTNSCPTKRAIPNTIYFSNSNSALGAKKMRLQDGNQLCILGPLKSAANTSVVLQETQNDASIANDRRPVVQVSINSIIGRNFMPASSTNPDPQLVARLYAFTNFIYLEMVVIVVWRAELPVDARNYAGRAEAEQNTGTNPWLVAQPY
uniref:SCA7 domain-containing protein n=1 Tax=Rhodnius prolixus TaxID=13249 RepID=T1HK13_RHOPR